MLECAMMINTYLIELSEVFIWVSTAEKVAQISLVKEHVLLEVVIGVADRLRLLLLRVDELLEGADSLGGILIRSIALNMGNVFKRVLGIE